MRPHLLLLPALAFLPALATSVPAPAAALHAQLEQGETTYILACAMCHGDRLEGVSAPALSGEHFRATYRTLPPQALHDLIQATMPATRRGTLSAQEVLDVTAYVLHANSLTVPEGGLTPADVQPGPTSAPTR
ncbi:cytochrome c [Deinococcus taeanensis]|uniref:c-type cytochrome n=1 Tax=Deinococcus taeanensis TaxID=2737050 RepID=UPI001CDB7B12|nr:cytochrome c [Deinococcus taeanensis]UBV42659.1 cytochrome c [Deinococcus taeanensis]